MEGKTILIVEDDEMARMSLSNFAKKRSLIPVVATSYSEAVAKIKENSSLYKAILIDYNLDENDKDINAFNLAKELKGIAGNNLGKLVVMSGGNKNI